MSLSIEPDSGDSRSEMEGPPRRWHYWLVPLGLGLLYLLWGALFQDGGANLPSALLSAEAQNAPPTRLEATGPRTPSSEALKAELPPAEQGTQSLAQARLLQAQERLNHYRQSTRYPPESRPAHEHDDQLYPGQELERRLPLEPEAAEEGIVLRVSQDRLFLVGDERAVLSLRCETGRGAPVPCKVVGATASAPSAPPAQDAQSELAPKPVPPPHVPPQNVPVPFTPDPGDTRAGNAYVASFQPSSRGFANYSGPLQVVALVSAGPREGGTAERGTVEAAADFDLQYTSTPPALFTGKVREVPENGSLSLYVGLKVLKPGRYVLAARLDDARGYPLAYLSFNEELATGTQQVKFVVFGKLIRDVQGISPFRLRDLDGFLLKENTDPDRALIPALVGTVHTTQRYALEQFSDAEWQSEEKDRYIREFTKDVEEAQAAQ